MAYEHLEEFLGRGDEKFLGPLSVSNLVGALAGCFFGYQLGASAGLPFLALALLTLASGIGGVAVTWRWGGMSLLSRIFWRARFYTRELLGSPAQTVDMDALGAAPTSQLLRQVRHGDTLIAALRDPEGRAAQ